MVHLTGKSTSGESVDSNPMAAQQQAWARARRERHQVTSETIRAKVPVGCAHLGATVSGGFHRFRPEPTAMRRSDCRCRGPAPPAVPRHRRPSATAPAPGWPRSLRSAPPGGATLQALRVLAAACPSSPPAAGCRGRSGPGASSRCSTDGGSDGSGGSPQLCRRAGDLAS